MAKSNTNSYMIRKNKPLLIAGLLILIISIIGGAYYLYQQKNLSSENASAGTVKEIKLDNFTLKLESVKQSVFFREAGTQWKYEIYGEVESCYGNPTVDITEEDTTENTIVSKALNTSNKPYSIVLKLKGSNCRSTNGVLKSSKTTKVLKDGTFLASNDTPLKFVVEYTDPIKTKYSIPGKGKVENIYTESIKLKSTTVAKGSTTTKGSWKATASGYVSTCLTPTLYTKTSSSKFTGEYILRLVKNQKVNEVCGTDKKTISVSKTIKSKRTSTYRTALTVRYVGYDLLTIKLNEKNLESNGYTLERRYLGNNKWTYTVTGNVPSGCYSLETNETISKSKPETILVSARPVISNKNTICTQSTRKVSTTKEITGSEDAIFTFDATVLSTSRENPEELSIVSNGYTLKYTFQGNNTWTYKVSGTIPSACYQIIATPKISNSIPEIVSMTSRVELMQTVRACAQATQTSEISGKLTASQYAKFIYVATNPFAKK